MEINTPGDLNLGKFQASLRDLLANQRPDLFRIKGASFADAAERGAFQGVEMLFDGRRSRPWREVQRANSLILIGRNPDRGAVNAGFNACLT